MEITFINVGYGESILVTCGSPEREDGQFVMLIDGGSSMDSEYTGNSGRIRARDFLRKKGIRHIDLIVFTHVHEDHTCGLLPVINELPVGQFWTSIRMPEELYGKQVDPEFITNETNRKALNSINTYSTLMQQLSGRDITWLDGIRSEYFREGELTIDVLGPESGYKENVERAMSRVFTAGTEDEADAAITETTESMNNASVILRLHYRGKKVLLVGDTNAQGFAHVFAEDPSLLQADIYKIGHHGQPDSVTEELVRAVDPGLIVCCASNDYRSNSSNEKTFETIQKALGTKPVTYLFQDGCYNEKWNPDTSPRSGVSISIENAGFGIRNEEC